MLKQLSQFYYFYETDVVVKKDSDASDATAASVAEID
jgi:hypothetical protein